MKTTFSENLGLLFERYKEIGFIKATIANKVLHCNPSNVTRYANGDTNIPEKDRTMMISFLVDKVGKDVGCFGQLCALSGLDKEKYDFENWRTNDEKKQEFVNDFEFKMINEVFPVARTETSVVNSDNDSDIDNDNDNDEAAELKSKIDELNKKLLVHKKLSVISILVSVIFLVSAVTVYAFAPAKSNAKSGTAGVDLDIIYYTPLGETEAYSGQSVVTGRITAAIGKNPSTDYAVTMAVVSQEDGRIYGPKPTTSPYKVTLTPGEKDNIGYFTCEFAGWNSPDITASELYVYVVDSDFSPDSDTQRTRENSVVQKLIVR